MTQDQQQRRQPLLAIHDLVGVPREQYQRLKAVELLRLRVLTSREFAYVVEELRNLGGFPPKPSLIRGNEVARRLPGLIDPQLVNGFQLNVLIAHTGPRFAA